MSGNLQLPAQGIEQEKWKAMVDSVVDFISASRAMLHLLNDKLADSEKWSEEQRKKIEEEKTMAAFYKDYLSLEITPKLDRMSAATGVDDTDLEKLKRDIETMPAMEIIEKNEEKSFQTCEKESAVEEHGDKSPITTSFRNKLFSSQETQLNVENKSEESQHVAEFKSINIQTCSKMENLTSKDVKCRKQCPRHSNNKLSPATATLPGKKDSSLQQSDNSLLRNPSKISKIPKTQSFSDSKNKSFSVERTLNEGPMIGKSICKKRLHKEANHQDSRQKCKNQIT